MEPAADRFDLIVIGAGINGAAIAREAALEGHRVLLLDQGDICSGTSAASTRLIHGGLRYLEHAELGLVRESLAERERLIRHAPHLVEPIELVLPIYSGASRRPWQIRIGMWLYDLLSFDKSEPRHTMLDREKTLARLPGLRSDDLLAAACYFDAQARYPERLVLENVLDAAAHGASVLSYARVTAIAVQSGRVTGVEWEQDSKRHRACADTIVNATGPWVDRLLEGTGAPRLIGGTQGSHIVAVPFPGAPASAVYAEARSDGRPFFVVPWNDLYLIGTTDLPYQGDPGAADMSSTELDYLVAETERLFSLPASLRPYLRYSQSGIRPLPHTTGVHPGAITRRHIVRRHREPTGLYSIIGGKLTTHRALAEDVMRSLRGRLRARGRSPTRNRPLPGALSQRDSDELLADLESRLGVLQAGRLWRIYGARARDIVRAIEGSDEQAMVLGPASAVFVAELVHAIEAEFAVTLGDLLLRRTMAGLDADFGLAAAPAAAEWMVRLGLWDKARAEHELAAYRDHARRFVLT